MLLEYKLWQAIHLKTDHSRVSRCTEGLTMLGKKATFVRRFNEALTGHRGKVTKHYRTLSAERPPLGAPLLTACCKDRAAHSG